MVRAMFGRPLTRFVARAPEGVLRRSILSCAVLCVASLCPADASADALPLTSTVQAGRPLKALKVGVEGAEPTVVTVGGRRVELPTRGARGATVESLRVGAESAVTLVRVEAANGLWVLLLGGRAGTAPLTSGRADWAGDPGERRMLLVEASEPDAAGARSVQFGTRYEGLTTCTGTAPLIDARSVDATTLEAVVSVRPFAGAAAAQQAGVVAVSEERPAPVLAGLDAAGSSKVEESTRFYLPPRALVDGSRDTSWTFASGDFATLRWSEPKIALRELELQVTVSGSTAPISLLALADGERAMRIVLPPPPDARTPVTSRLRVTPGAPLTTRCLALVADQLPKGASLSISDVRAYTELDEPGSVEKLVSLLVQDGEPGAGAADLLSALGETGAVAVAARYDELSPRGKRRALRVLARGLDRPEVLSRVAQATHEDSTELRTQALTVLQAGGEPGRAALRELVSEPSELGDAAAKALVARPGETPALLRALAAPKGSERTGLRNALSQAARREPQVFAAEVDAWLSQGPSAQARGSLAVAVANAGVGPLVLRIAEPAWGAEALEFPERYRFAHALARAEASEPADGWLEREALGASEWMMRRVAFEALEARGPERARAVALKLATDAYPRVRASSLGSLARNGDLPQASQLATQDSWPLVRAAGARALALRPEARTVLEALVGDASPRVRTEAIDALATQRATQAWPVIEPHLRERTETPEVHSAAIGYARELCLASAKDALAEAVRRALRPDASEDEARTGVLALHALHDLGGAAAADAKSLATRPEAPPGLAKSYATFAAPVCERRQETRP
jgi:hypothetical protein